MMVPGRTAWFFVRKGGYIYQGRRSNRDRSFGWESDQEWTACH